MKIDSRWHNEVKQKAKNLFMKALNGDLFRTELGECWHSDRQCASNRTANVVFRMRPCKCCAYKLGKLLLEEPSSNEGEPGHFSPM